MREVEVSRFIQASRPEIERLLTPRSVIEYEGTFTVYDVTEIEDGWRVTARVPGMQAQFVVEARDEGMTYEQEGDAGPFETMETIIDIESENEGVRVTMRSAVSLGLPIPTLTDRVAAWKRRGELKRALARLARDAE